MAGKKLCEIQDLFKRFSFLNITMVGEYADVNPSLLRHCASGTKVPSKRQLRKIQNAIYSMAKEMLSITLIETQPSNIDKLKFHLGDPIRDKSKRNILQVVD